MLLLFFISPFSLYRGPRSGHYFRSVFASSFHCTGARDLGGRNVVFWFLFCLVFSKYSGPRSGHGVGSVLPDIRLGWLGHCWAHSPGL